MSGIKKILIVEDGHSDLHGKLVARALLSLGYEVHTYFWCSLFCKKSNIFISLTRRFENKFLLGPTINRLNEEVISNAISISPDLIFFYRGTHIRAKTLKRIKSLRPSCLLVGYNNDDPFSAKNPSYLMRHFLDSIHHYDVMLAYRVSNVERYLSLGLTNVKLLRSWFDKERTRPIFLKREDKERFECDVVFVGHYEDDGRIDYLESIVNRGFNFKLFGPEWNRVLKNHPTLGHLYPVEYVYESDYCKALNGAKIALCFFSKINNDTYTRRCFEVPACRTLLLSEYSEDMAGLFEEGVEAAYFRDQEELLSKLGYYLTHEDERSRVIENGYKRVFDDGHDVESRMQDLLTYVSQLRVER